MKKGINIWSFPQDLSLKDCIIMARQAGFDGIEPALAEEGDISTHSTEKEILAVKRAAENEGIEIPSLATGLYWTYSLTSNDSGVRRKAEDIVKKQLDTAALLSADTILVVPGSVGVDFVSDSEVIDYDTAYDRSLEALSRLKDHAEDVKVSIGIENVWNKFLLSLLEMRDFIDRIDSCYVGAYFDVGNVVQTGYPDHWIKILGKRIRKVHFKDFRRSVGTLSGFVDLLAGDVDFPKVTETLKQVGYNDFCTAEITPGYRYYSDQTVFNTSMAMDKILSIS